jgi:hypothetical protein
MECYADDDENLHVASINDDLGGKIEKVGEMSFVREQDNAIVHRETTRDNNNMATLSGTEYNNF